jgi:hypothetical protein
MVGLGMAIIIGAFVFANRKGESDIPGEDPDKPITDSHEQLSHGQPVTLIGAKGPPQWYRWSLGRGAIQDCPLHDNTFYIHSYDPCLLELMRAPLPRRYVFRAEVCHIIGDEAVVGIYFAYHKNANPQGVEHSYAELIFNDDRVVKPRWVQLRLHRHREKGVLPTFDYPGTTGISKKLQVNHERGKLSWRSIKVIVTPDKILCSWENKPFRWGLKNADRIKRARQIFEDNPNVDPKQAFSPQGALGLYVQRGGAAFRNVRIEPVK